jgi:outer membrane protein assembly factor BamB
MKLPQRIKTPLSLLIIFIAIFLLLWICSPPPEEPLRITRTLASSTKDVSILWLRQDIPTLIATDAEGIAYATRLFGKNNLIAFDIKSGSTKWMIDLPFELGGAVGIFAGQNTVFVITGSYVNAYEKTVGELKWSLKLGDGHVSVVSQLDDSVLRVYYGDTLFEIDPETGIVLASKPKRDLIWITGNIEFHTSSANRLTAFDGNSNQRLWNLDRSFFISEGWKPKESEEGVLIVGYQALMSNSLIREICALNLRTGKYNWCHTENYISDIAIDRQSQIGYVMRADFVLEEIDLSTGSILGEIRFLPNTLPEEMLRFSYSYSVTLNDSIVIVSFGDSSQTFGLALPQSNSLQTPASVP